MDKTLQHYGILGMRWGVRRTKAQLRRARGPDAPRRVTKEQYEAEKQKAINSGDKATIERWKSRLSNTEYKTAIDRLKLDYDLQTAGKEKMRSGWQKTTEVMQGISTTVSFIKTGLDAYDIVRKVNNTFNDKKLPGLDGVSAKEKAAEKAKQDAKDEAAIRSATAEMKTKEAGARKAARAEFDELYDRYFESRGMDKDERPKHSFLG